MGEITAAMRGLIGNMADVATETNAARHLDLTWNAARDPEVHEAIRQVLADGHSVVLWESRRSAYPTVDIYPDGIQPDAQTYRALRRRVILAPWVDRGLRNGTSTVDATQGRPIRIVATHRGRIHATASGPNDDRPRTLCGRDAANMTETWAAAPTCRQCAQRMPATTQA